MHKSLGMSSRGNESEQEMLIADLLHVEQHLAEAIQKNPSLANELSSELDQARLTRQKAVQLWSGGKQNADAWCATKHCLEATRRSQELLENTSRLEPEQMSEMAVIANDIVVMKDSVKNVFLSGEGSGGCKRCAGDLSIEDVSSGSGVVSVSRVKKVKSVSSDNSAVYFILLALGVGVALFAFSQLKK